MNAEKTGILIYDMRTRKGLTQKELAEKCNVSDKAVSKWERGEGCPDVTVLPKLAKVFGIEVDSIMKGEIPFSQDVNGKTIKDYDFRQPDRYPKYMQREIWMLGEDICQTLNRECTVILNERCDFWRESVDQLTNKEFLASIPQKCFFYDFDYTNVQTGGFTVEVDSQLAKALLKQDAGHHDKITDFDLTVFRDYFLKLIVQVIFENVEKQTGGAVNLNKQCPLENARLAATANNSRQEENRMLLLLSLKGKVGEAEGWINLQFSDVLLEILLRNGFFSDGSTGTGAGVGVGTGGENTTAGSHIKIQNLSNIKKREAPDNIFIEFGRFRPENVSLEPGTILILDKKETDGLNVVFENRVIHTGKTVVIDENFGIEIAETTQLGEIVYDETDYLSVQLGSSSLSKQEVAALHQGSYIILKQRAGEFTQIIRAGKLVALGEICIADDNFAIRVVEVKN